MANTKRQTTEQRRAASAWDDVNSISNGDREEYKTRVRQLAPMIQMNGLGSTMAFLLSKPSKPAYKQVYDHISDWVTASNQLNYDDELMTLIRNEDMQTYRRATTEAIEYAIWLKRYVESWK